MTPQFCGGVQLRFGGPLPNFRPDGYMDESIGNSVDPL
jgi:hypothetical protein